MDSSAKRKRTESPQHMEIDYPPLRNLEKDCKLPNKSTLVVVKHENEASVPHPGIDVVFGDERVVQALDGYGGRLWVPSIGRVDPFVSGLHYLCTFGPNIKGATIQWYENPILRGIQCVRLNKFDDIIAKLKCDDLEDFIRKLKSYMSRYLF